MKRYTVTIEERAFDDLENLVDYIFSVAGENTVKKYYQGIMKTIYSLSANADIYAISTYQYVLKYGSNARRINYKKMTVIYTVHDDIVVVHRVIPQSWIISGID